MIDTGITAADIETYAAIIRSEMAGEDGQRANSRRAAERIVSLALETARRSGAFDEDADEATARYGEDR